MAAESVFGCSGAGYRPARTPAVRWYNGGTEDSVPEMRRAALRMDTVKYRQIRTGTDMDSEEGFPWHATGKLATLWVGSYAT